MISMSEYHGIEARLTIQTSWTFITRKYVPQLLQKVSLTRYWIHYNL